MMAHDVTNTIIIGIGDDLVKKIEKLFFVASSEGARRLPPFEGPLRL